MTLPRTHTHTHTHTCTHAHTQTHTHTHTQVQGRKKWIMYPPHIKPPLDEDEVSLLQWFVKDYLYGVSLTGLAPTVVRETLPRGP